MGRQAADTGTYATALSESGNKESTHSHCVPSQVSAVATTYNCSNCQQSATRCVDCGTANTSKHSFFSLQLQNYAKLCRRKKMYKKDFPYTPCIFVHCGFRQVQSFDLPCKGDVTRTQQTREPSFEIKRRLCTTATQTEQNSLCKNVCIFLVFQM